MHFFSLSLKLCDGFEPHNLLDIHVGRISISLLRFPVKQSPTPKKEPQAKRIVTPVKETVAQRVRQGMKKQEDKQGQAKTEKATGEDEAVCRSLSKRDKNIQENKAMVVIIIGSVNTMANNMDHHNINVDRPSFFFLTVVFQLAKLFADLTTMADLTLPDTPQVSTAAQPNTPVSTNRATPAFLYEPSFLLASPQKKKRSPMKATPRKRKLEQRSGSERRNPSRKARPPENFAVDQVCEPLPRGGPKAIDLRRLVEVQMLNTTSTPQSSNLKTSVHLLVPSWVSL